jgi:Zn-finger nucleic acid-binding protein
MAVRVICPNCGAALEVDARDAGELVLCGTCREVFVADAPAGERRAESRRAWENEEDDPPRRRYYEDDDDYRPRRRRRPPGGEGYAVTSLVLGILACVVFCCWPFSLSLGGLGAVFGALGLKSRSRGMAVAGLTLSLVGLIFGGGFAVVTTAGVVKAEYERGSQTNPRRPVFQGKN